MNRPSARYGWTGPAPGRRTLALLVAGVLPAALLFGPAVPRSTARAAAHAAPSGPRPLAMELDEVETPDWNRRVGRAAVPTGGEVLFRVPPDSLVAELMDSTSVANMTATIERLQAFGSRYVVTDSCWAAGYWIRDRFAELGYTDVRLDTFRTWTFQDSVEAMNVIAVKRGAARPEKYVVLGGHYDSVTTGNFEDPFAPAPGAEDNATAVAAVLEAARLLADVPTDRSIIFACWSAEEEGLWGSRAFVADALAESLEIVAYLNMDCIGYLAPDVEEPPIIAFADSLSYAIAGYMQTLAAHTQYELQTRIQPIGASDHNSFWEAGYNVVDTGTTISSPYRHTTDDVIENIEPGFARAIAAINVAATAAVAGVTGEDPNLPPETVPVATCATGNEPVTMTPTFEWRGVDFDGSIELYEYAVDSDIDGRPQEWKQLPPEQTSIKLDELPQPGTYVFMVRAIDNRGAIDPLPVEYEFTAADSLHPRLTVDTNFLPQELAFVGPHRAERSPPVRVYEGERLVFAISSDASSYCGEADSVAVAVGDSSALGVAWWSEWKQSPYEFVLRPAAGDTLVSFRTRDTNGAVTSGSVSLRMVPAPMDRPLLRVDDWFVGSVEEHVHDSFYAAALAGESCDTWDPYEHFEGYVPTLPPMDELGRYRTVMWTLDAAGGLLRPAQAESAYHYVEGFVRAGGNLILEGQSSLTTLGGADLYTYRPTYVPGDFLYDHVGIDSLRNAGSSTNTSFPDLYGYAFLGGLAASGWPGLHVPVDTLGKWASGYLAHGGLPLCEIARPTPGTLTLYRFDSYLNESLDGRPCATARFPEDGTGAVVWLGFPLYYIQDAPAAEMVTEVLDAVRAWQAPAELLYFEWTAGPDSVALEWFLNPPDDPRGCFLERKDGGPGAPGEFVRLTDSPIEVGGDSRFRFVDRTVEELSDYAYRLVVLERWGGTSTHGPWLVQTPSTGETPWLAQPYPNPFSSVVMIRYGLGPGEGPLSLRVYDVSGRLVTELTPGRALRGIYETAWDGTDLSGNCVASGVYFVRATTAGTSVERKLVYLRDAR